MKIHRICFLLWLSSACLFQAQAQSSVRLFLNEGTFYTVDSTNMPALALNLSASFNQTSDVVEFNVGDSIHLHLINNTNVSRSYAIQALSVSGQIPAQDSVLLTLKSEKTVSWILSAANEADSYLGQSTMITAIEPNSSNFYWNIREHQVEAVLALNQQQNFDWATYNPDYFTINGRSNPEINQDPVARVVGQVGDTIFIHMANTGRSIHSIHFHGYHCEVVQSSRSALELGRVKDTFGIYPGQMKVLRLVPHQSGEYPVHDHNLVAVTAGGIYPNGMFTTLLIQ